MVVHLIQINREEELETPALRVILPSMIVGPAMPSDPGDEGSPAKVLVKYRTDTDFEPQTWIISETCEELDALLVAASGGSGGSGGVTLNDLPTTLVAGEATIPATGITAATRFIPIRTAGNASSAFGAYFEYSFTAVNFTVTAKTAAGATETNDVGSYLFLAINS